MTTNEREYIVDRLIALSVRVYDLYTACVRHQVAFMPSPVMLECLELRHSAERHEAAKQYVKDSEAGKYPVGMCDEVMRLAFSARVSEQLFVPEWIRCRRNGTLTQEFVVDYWMWSSTLFCFTKQKKGSVKGQ